MILTVYYNCPECLAENSTDFDTHDHSYKIDECCECNYEFTEEEMEELHESLCQQAFR